MCSQKTSNYVISKLLIIATLGFSLTMLNACTPRQFGSDQCSDININLTEARDLQYVGNISNIDIIMQGIVSSPNVPGCAVGVMKNNEIFYLKGYGDANLGDITASGDETPWGVGTPSVVGSISKTLTTLAVLRLQEMGYLSIDDLVSDHLSVPIMWEGITIKELLSHTSGLENFPTFYASINTELELSQFLFPNLPTPIPHLGIFPYRVYPSYFATLKPGFLSGDTAYYSNTGYMILGAMIERILSENSQEIGVASYERFVWREVGFFDQSIQSSDQLYSICLNEYWRQGDIKNLALGYSRTEFAGVLAGPITYFNSETERDGVNMSRGPAGWEGPAGAWTMTIGDLVRLMLAIENDLIISADSRNEMLFNLDSSISNNRGYGYDSTKSFGLGVYRAKGALPSDDPRNRMHYMHDGVYPGYKARFTVWPNEDFGVAVMCNGTGANVRTPTVEIAKLFIDDTAASATLPPQTKVAIVVDAPEDDPGDDPGLGVDPESTTLPNAIAANESALLYSNLLSIRSTQRMEEKRELQALSLRCATILDVVFSDISDPMTIPGQIAGCSDMMDNPGHFMQCVAIATNVAVQRNQISGAQKGLIDKCAALAKPLRM